MASSWQATDEALVVYSTLPTPMPFPRRCALNQVDAYNTVKPAGYYAAMAPNCSRKAYQRWSHPHRPGDRTTTT